ncbi:MAG: hypothetical protein ABUL60_08100 [Myxococcales bacterium]
MTSASEPPLHGLTYDSTAARLRAACRLGGAALLASPLLPFQLVDGQPVFIWEILGELHPATAVAVLVPALAGAVLLFASYKLARPSLLAFLTLLVLGTWSLISKLGADAAAWDVSTLPESLNRRVELYVLSIALSGASLRLLAEPAARQASRVVAAMAVATGVIFGVWPSEGEAPLQTCLRFVGALAELPDPRLVLGYGLVLTIAVFPLVAAAVALALSLSGRGSHTALVAELTTFGAPGLLFALALRNVLATFGDISVVVTTAIASALAALLALTARSLELLALAASGMAKSSDYERSARPERFVRLAATAALLSAFAVFLLARPLQKGVDWRLGPRSDRADQLFGELMPAWAQSRARWSMNAKTTASAAELAEARAAANQILRASRELKPELGRAVAELVQGGGDLDLAGRRWFHLIEAVNETSRAAGLPYYLDPGLSVAEHQGRVERLFLLHPYRVEAVRPARADGIAYALLAVRRLGKARDNHDRLGFSRDHQPFALVVLDEIESYSSSLDDFARRAPATCVDSDAAPPELATCGALLQKLSPNLQQVRRLVERHELQHQIDGPELTHSAAVLEALAGYERAAIDQVNRELSAYMAELVTEQVPPKLALVHVMPFLTSRSGSALHFVVHLELAALAGERPKTALSQDSRAIFDELSALPDDKLRERARAAYERLFHADLLDVK